MDAGLPCVRGAPGRARDTPEALRTRGSLPWALRGEDTVPCLPAARGSRAGQQPTLQGAASSALGDLGLLRLVWRGRGRVVSIILGTPRTRSRSHCTHGRARPHPGAVAAPGVLSPGCVAAPQLPPRATRALSCAATCPSPQAGQGTRGSANSGSNW